MITLLKVEMLNILLSPLEEDFQSSVQAEENAEALIGSLSFRLHQGQTEPLPTPRSKLLADSPPATPSPNPEPVTFDIYFDGVLFDTYVPDKLEAIRQGKLQFGLAAYLEPNSSTSSITAQFDNVQIGQ
jgi:hypothetical protein